MTDTELAKAMCLLLRTKNSPDTHRAAMLVAEWVLSTAHFSDEELADLKTAMSGELPMWDNPSPS
jgi:hypothetical protein